MTVGWDTIDDSGNGQPPILEPDGLPLSQHCGVWPFKAKLGPVAVSIASAYPTAQWSANYLLTLLLDDCLLT